MPNWFKFFLIAAALVVLPSFASADSAVSVQPVPAAASVGDTIVVNVNISDVVDLYAVEFDLAFDPAVLAAQSVNEGSFLPTGGSTLFIPGTIDNVGGSVLFNADSLIGAIPGVTGGGTLVSFDFLAVGSGISGLSLQNAMFLDSNLSDVEVALEDSSVTVSGGPVGTPEPSAILLLLASLVVVFFLARLRPGVRGVFLNS
jgi:hypothetical protein